MTDEVTPKFSKPNSKLAGDIWSWGIPAADTCPGATAACLSTCYARRGHFLGRNVRELYRANEAFSRTEFFVDWARAQLIGKRIRMFRIHVAGDFYDAEYTQKWVDIVSHKSIQERTRFYFYTRSWHNDELEISPVIRRLAKQKNVEAWLSGDIDTGRPPRWVNTRLAFMARNDAEAKACPAYYDLCFRERPTGRVMKKAGVGNVQVCPHEIGLPLHVPKITCAQCGICTDPPRTSADKSLTQLGLGKFAGVT